jgi:SAP domain-containing ribonucleoprotein
LEEEKSLLDSTTDADDILKSPAQSTKSDSPEITTATKRVSLKRNVSVTVPVISTEPAKKAEESTEDASKETSSTSEPEKKIIKISELSVQDRLELRAKKFGNATGTVSSSSDKLDARAARFGVTTATTADSTKSNKITITASAPIEVLKKRAERFGAATSTDLKKSEMDEKLQKRQERFGSAAPTTGSVKLSDTTSVDYAEKARLRAERFKTAV